jgi:hypothetical protein
MKYINSLFEKKYKKYVFICVHTAKFWNFHAYFIKNKKLHFYQTWKKMKKKYYWVSQICDYPLGFVQNFKNTIKINLFN